MLVKLFCKRFADMHGKAGTVFDEDAIRVLRHERWPGNVRQLQNFVERLVVLSTKPLIAREDVTAELSRKVHFVTQAPSSIGRPPLPSEPATPPAEGGSSALAPLDEQVRQAERAAIVRALEQAKGNRTVAAKLLGINRRTLFNKMADHALKTGADEAPE